jgi:predicted alpha/beta-hydrolase family hydrolase
MSPSGATGGLLDVGGRRASWLREGTLTGRPLVLLAHGAGAAMKSDFMTVTARGLVERGCAVARFQFPYMEQHVREGKRMPPNPAPVLIATWRAMLAKARQWRTRGPLILMGKSLGGRMASMFLAEGDVPEARGVVYLGYPLHPPGKPDQLRSDHLPDVPVPQLFVQGSKDALCDLRRLAPVLARIGPAARLTVVEGGDHSLVVKKTRPLEGTEVWLDEVRAFIREVTEGA